MNPLPAPAVAAEIFHRPFEQTVFKRLTADIDALIENIRGPPLLPRHQMRQLFPVLVHARQPPGHLRRAGFEADDF